MSEGSKRKQGPGASRGAPFKKSKGGSGGRWQTPFQKAKQAGKIEMGTTLAVHDSGIWVTYARGMRGKAMREFKTVCDEYGESLFGVKPPSDKDEDKKEAEEEADEEIDFEAAVEKELAAMSSKKPKERQVFTLVSTSLECLFFMKVMDPIEPNRLVAQMCEDARNCPDVMKRKTKYINRLTPVLDTDKSTESGIERVARSVLASTFQLKPESGEDDAEKAANPQDEGEVPAAACTYAIRHNIRNNPGLRSDTVIKKIAGLVSSKHKVNLTSPDKVVLVEIFQTFCGISVVDGKQWEELRRYNVNEMYKLASENSKPAAEETTEST